MSFGKNLKSAREEAGLSQEQLARKIDVVVYTVSKWEQGAHEPPLAMIRRVAEALGTTAARLVEEAVAPATGERDATN